MTVSRERVDELIAFARDHESEPVREGDLVAAKSALLARALGPGADAQVVGPMTRPGQLNGLIVHEGEVVAEFGDTAFVDEIASATKSFLALLAGLAVDDGLITDLDEHVGEDLALAEFQGEHNGAITWRQLLYQTSEWDGTLFGKMPTGHRGQRIGEPLGVPGSFWEYNDVRVNLLARALLEVFGRPLPDVLAERVMEPIGASDTWSWHGYETSWVTVGGCALQSVSGGSHWGGGIWMSSRDLALVGRLMLARGWWDGTPVIPESWIAAVRTPCVLNPMYGLMWWLQHDATRAPVSYAAQGGGSHQCIVVPDHDLLVVVRWIRDDAWPAFLDRALTIVDDRPPLGPVRYLFDEINPLEPRGEPSRRQLDSRELPIV
jgi:CubicO group peptidase (beta-lactamase class C family)